MYDEWGISNGYHDVSGTWHRTTDATRERLGRSMGTPVAGPPMWFVAAGTVHDLWSPCNLHLEDGTVLHLAGRLPADLPIGYHDLVADPSGPTTRLVVHPTTCPPLPHTWGVAVQTASLWSERSWGIGDLGDLRVLAQAVVAAGGGALLTSPLHQPAPTEAQEPSPYYPSTRRGWSPLLLAIDAPPTLACDPDELIDRDAAWSAKRAQLEAAFAQVPQARRPEPSSVAWWNACCDEYGTDWRQWPEAAFAAPSAAGDRGRAEFHEWLQECIEEQLAAISSTGVLLIGDLAVGFSPSGADAHEYRDVLADDIRMGAPPDQFNAAGQEWGLPPFVPWKLRAACYQPFIETVRAALRGVQGLRIDHVMGLFRQFWVPVGLSPTDGAYVGFAAEELLAILCLEATRAGAFVIGEDLGTVGPEVREMLAERRIAGTRVMWFEDTPPREWPRGCLATITTHDLPTIAGVWEGSDGDDEMRRRLAAVAGDARTATEAVALTHSALLDAPADLRLLSADDLCASPRRPNLPGTNTYPSWRVRLALPASELL